MLDGIDHTRLIRFAERIVGRTAAEDVVQDVYVKFLSDKVPPFRGESERETWLLAIVKKTAISWKNREERLNENGVAREQSYTPHYDEWIDTKSRLMRLSPKYREVLILAATHGTWSSIAKELGLTRQQVKARLKRARRKLREQI